MERHLGPSGYRSGLWLVRWSIAAILGLMTNGDTKQWCSCIWERLLSLCWYWVNLTSTVMVCAYHKSTLPSHVRPKAVIFSVHTSRNGRGFPASFKISFPWKTTSQYKHFKFTFTGRPPVPRNFFSYGAAAQREPWPPHYEVSRSHTTTQHGR